MYACIDVDYRPDPAAPGREQAVAACLEFERWTDAVALAEHVRRIPDVAPYVSGRFFERELPCALAILADLGRTPDLVIIDGYVFLDDQGRAGFGVHLWQALGEHTPVIGVAKNRFRSNPAAIELLRGGSTRPLFVTAIGIDVGDAAEHVRAMHGEHRLPTLLKRVDRLCRDGLSPVVELQGRAGVGRIDA
ncbi:endonuclease V [Nannocystaceae bacterium ST9]